MKHAQFEWQEVRAKQPGIKLKQLFKYMVDRLGLLSLCASGRRTGVFGSDFANNLRCGLGFGLSGVGHRFSRNSLNRGCLHYRGLDILKRLSAVTVK